jgi:hypothetical protein
MAAIEQPLIYPAQTVLTLIGRAWNLYRKNWKQATLVLVPVAILQTVLGIIGSVLSNGTFLTPTSSGRLIVVGILGLSMVVGYFLFWFLWVACSATLSRFFYSAILEKTPLSLRDCWKNTRKNGLNLFLITLVVMVLTGFTMVLYVVLLMLSLFLVSVPMSALMGAPALPVWFRVILSIGLIFVAMIGFACVMTVQFFVSAFPALAVINRTTRQTDVFECIRNGVQQVFSNIPRLIPFFIALFFFSGIASMTFLMPYVIWVALEMSRLGPEQQHHLPLHIGIVGNLVQLVQQLIYTPFINGALTLFWYDCQVRREGLDLRLWFNNMLRRRGQLPETYATDWNLMPNQG